MKKPYYKPRPVTPTHTLEVPKSIVHAKVGPYAMQLLSTWWQYRDRKFSSHAPIALVAEAAGLSLAKARRSAAALMHAGLLGKPRVVITATAKRVTRTVFGLSFGDDTLLLPPDAALSLLALPDMPQHGGDRRSVSFKTRRICGMDYRYRVVGAGVEDRSRSSSPLRGEEEPSPGEGASLESVAETPESGTPKLLPRIPIVPDGFIDTIDHEDESGTTCFGADRHWTMDVARREWADVARKFVGKWMPFDVGQPYTPPPPKLCASDGRFFNAQVLMKSYLGGIRTILKVSTNWLFRQPNITESRHFPRFVEAAALFEKYGIAPAKWVAWSIWFWKETCAKRIGRSQSSKAGRRQKRKFPSVGWMFSPKRIESRRELFFEESEHYLGYRLVVGPLARDATERWHLTQACIQQGEEPWPALRRNFPNGYKAAFRAAREESAATVRKLEAAVINGDWIWSYV